MSGASVDLLDLAEDAPLFFLLALGGMGLQLQEGGKGRGVEDGLEGCVEEAGIA